MESQRDKRRHSTAQVIYVTRKDTIRLLEVYVKRSLSLNDGRLDSTTNERKTEKWVPVARRRRIRSGDPSIHFDDHGKNELVNRLTALMKKEGDAIEVKLKDYPTVTNFLQGMTYSAFQKFVWSLQKERLRHRRPSTFIPDTDD